MKNVGVAVWLVIFTAVVLTMTPYGMGYLGRLQKEVAFNSSSAVIKKVCEVRENFTEGSILGCVYDRFIQENVNVWDKEGREAFRKNCAVIHHPLGHPEEFQRINVRVAGNTPDQQNYPFPVHHEFGAISL